MRAYVPEYDLKVATSLKEALAEISSSTRPFAGGTDLMVLFEAGMLKPGSYVSILGLKELKGISESKTTVTIGGLSTYTEIRQSKRLAAEFPLLGHAAQQTGAIAIQNRGTIAGNIANASPAADTPPALLVYDAVLNVVSKSGTREIPYTTFHTAYKKTLLKDDELIESITLPRNFKGWKSYYRKVGTRKAQAISKVVLAGVAKKKGTTLEAIHLGLGSVAPLPLRAVKTEAILQGQKLSPGLILKAKETLEKEISPIDDIRSEASYRRFVAKNLLQEFLESL